jgi:methyl-accepting chemotaxis protein
MARSTRIGLTPKLMVTTSVLLAVASVAGIVTTQVVASRLSSSNLDSQVSSGLSGLNQATAAEASRATSLAEMVAQMPEVRQAFANDDRDALLTMLEPSFTYLKANYGVEQFQFHTPPATSYLRIHKPEKYGDDLSSFRQTVVEANANQSVVSGVEGGVAGLGLRGVVPVKAPDGSFLGTVEIGLSVNAAFWANFQSRFGLDSALYIPDEKGTLTLNSTTLAQEPAIDPAALERAFKGEDVNVNTTLNGTPYVLALRPFSDYSGKTVAVVMLAIDVKAQQAALSQARMFGIIVGLVVLILGLAASALLARGISRSVTQPVARMGELLRAVAAGDLTKRAVVNGTPEIAGMASALNTTLDSMTDTISSIREASGRLSSASGSLALSADNMTSTAERASASAHEASDATQQVSANVAVVAASSEEMGASIAEIAQNASEASTVATTALVNTRATSEAVGRLSESSNAIGEAIKTITSIATQTNLLALNATIEAARAGSAGKGFAVVAAEVKELAQQTSTFTEEIAHRIETIQADSDEAVTSITAIAEIVAHVNDLQAAIASAVEEQSATTSEISRSVNEAAMSADAIAHTVERVADASQDTAEGALASNEASRSLADVAQQLDTLVHRFTVSGAEPARATAEL